MTRSDKHKPAQPKKKIYLSEATIRQILSGQITLREALDASPSHDG